MSTPLRPDTWSGLLIAVGGSRGAGSSLLAACLAQDLAGDASNRGLVLLAHVAAGGGRDSMHSCREVAAPDSVARAQVHGDDDLDGLLGAYRFVVADIEADIADAVGTAPGLTVATLRRSDLVVVVGAGDTRRLHSLVQTIEALAGLVGAERILPVVNRLPRGFRRRSAAVAETVRLLSGSAAFEAGDPVLIAERDAVGRAVRDGRTPPSSLVRPLSSEVRLRLATASRAGNAPAPPDLSAVAGD